MNETRYAVAGKFATARLSGVTTVKIASTADRTVTTSPSLRQEKRRTPGARLVHLLLPRLPPSLADGNRCRSGTIWNKRSTNSLSRTPTHGTQTQYRILSARLTGPSVRKQTGQKKRRSTRARTPQGRLSRFNVPSIGGPQARIARTGKLGACGAAQTHTTSF